MRNRGAHQGDVSLPVLMFSENKLWKQSESFPGIFLVPVSHQTSSGRWKSLQNVSKCFHLFRLGCQAILVEKTIDSCWLTVSIMWLRGENGGRQCGRSVVSMLSCCFQLHSFHLFYTLSECLLPLLWPSGAECLFGMLRHLVDFMVHSTGNTKAKQF